jgi:hypothetical protein
MHLLALLAIFVVVLIVAEVFWNLLSAAIGLPQTWATVFAVPIAALVTWRWERRQTRQP